MLQRSKLKFTMRRMLIAVALIAIGCAWPWACGDGISGSSGRPKRSPRWRTTRC